MPRVARPKIFRGSAPDKLTENFLTEAPGIGIPDVVDEALHGCVELSEADAAGLPEVEAFGQAAEEWLSLRRFKRR